MLSVVQILCFVLKGGKAEKKNASAIWVTLNQQN